MISGLGKETLRTGCISAEFAIKSARRIIYIGPGPWREKKVKKNNRLLEPRVL
jgi:hypothetical protein